MQQHVGTCGNCGGRVIFHTVQWVAGPMMPPRCERCGSVPKSAKPPIVDMEPPPGCLPNPPRGGTLGRPTPCDEITLPMSGLCVLGTEQNNEVNVR